MTTEFAYMAGYIDGDGCLYIGTYDQKPKNITVFEYSIQILSVDRENLINFQKHGGIVRQKAQRPNQKIPYFWCLKNCAVLASHIFPYLIDKQFQCKCLIEIIKSVKGTNYQAVGQQTFNYRKNLIDMCRRNKVTDLVTEELINKLRLTKPSIIPTSEDFAYLAGLIESEGTFRIKSWKPPKKPNNVFATSLEIGNTRYPIFPWLMDRFGGNLSFRHKNRNKRAVAIWSIQAKSLSLIIKRIHVFLRGRKKGVCEQIMEFNETILPNGGDRHSKAFKERMNDVVSKRELIIDEIHKLNKKGV
jgi:hypothetical protein